MKTCATCRFLGAEAPLEVFDEDSERSASAHRRCVRIIHGNAYGNTATSLATFAEPAVVTDGSGYAASLRVLPTFGCALHEVKS